MSEKLIQNRYRILGKIGKGGMGTVFKAEDTLSPGRILALKRIGLGDAGYDKLPYLRHEFKTLVELQHPNLGAVHDFGEIPDRKEWYFTSDYIDGVDLLEAAPNLSWDDLLDIVVQICHALEYIHSRDIIHHDVKPRNILVRMEEASRPQVKIVDFGLSAQAAAPAEGQIRGTVHYIAPEIIRGDAVDGRADLYSLGATLYHVVTGRPPFDGDTRIEIIRRHLHDPPTPPGDLREDLPKSIGDLLLDLLAKSPADRLQSANQVIGEINRTSSRQYPPEPEEAAGTLLRGCFVGRTKELADLSSALEGRTSRGRSGKTTALVLVEAEAGMGKSRFMREFQVRCQVDGIPFLHGEFREEGDKLFGPLGDVIAQVLPLLEAIELRRPEGSPGARILERYAAELKRVAPELTGAASPPASSIESEEAKLTFLERLARFFVEALQDTPAAICLSDLQWAHEGALEFVEHLAGVAADERFLLIGTYQPEEIGDGAVREVLDRLAQRGDTHLIRLGGIERDDVALLVRSMLGSGRIPDGLIDYLTQATGGNPFFVAEAMRQLVEAGTLRYGGGRWVLADPEVGATIPTEIREMILNRLDRIPPSRREVLEVLAVLDRPSSPDDLARTGGFESQALLSDLRSLERQGFVTRESSEGGLRFSVAHTLVREVAYERMDRARRKQIHGRIAERMTAGGAESPLAELEVLAHHLVRGPYPARSVPFLIAAGDHSRWLHADEEAIRLYQEAFTILGEDDPVTSLQLLEALGEIHQRVGRYDEAISLQERMIRIARLLDDKTAHGRAHLRLAEVLRLRGEFQEAEKHAVEALDTFREIDELEEVTRALGALGAIHWSRGDAEKALASFQECLAVHREIGNAAGVADSLSHLGVIHGSRGAHEEALECHREALRLREEARDRSGAAASLAEVGQILRARGQYENALEPLRRSLSIRREIADPLGAAATLELLGRLHGDRGEYPLALQACAESLKIRARVGNRPGVASALARIGRIYLTISDVPIATHFQGQALSAAREIGDRRLEASVLCDAGLCRLRKEDVSEAKDLLAQAVDLGRATGEVEVKALAEYGLASLALVEGRAKEAAVKGAGIIASGEAIQSPRLKALGHGLRGEAGRRLGTGREAVADLEEAVRLAQELGDPDLLWRASHWAGRAAADEGRLEEAAHHYLRALKAIEGVAAALDDDVRESYLSDARKKSFQSDAIALQEKMGL